MSRRRSVESWGRSRSSSRTGSSRRSGGTRSRSPSSRPPLAPPRRAARSSSGSLPLGRTPPPERNGRQPSRSSSPSSHRGRYRESYRRPRSASASPQRRSESPYRRGPTAPPNRTLFVGSLPSGTKQKDVADFFGQYGPVATVKLIYNHETDEFKGFGFVTMQSAADAHDAADDANGKEILGARIRCNPARDTRSMRGPERDYRRSSPRRQRSIRGSSDRSLSASPGVRRSPWRDRGYGRRRRSSAHRSISNSPPPLRKRPRPDAYYNDPPGTIAGASEVSKLRAELQELRSERQRLADQSGTAAATSQALDRVVEAAKRKVDKQQAKLRTITARSQRRGHHMVSLVEAAKAVSGCQQAVRQAEAALKDAEARLAEVVAETEAYVLSETAEREAEDAAKAQRSKMDEPAKGREGARGAQAPMAAAASRLVQNGVSPQRSTDSAAVERPQVARPGPNSKPFRFSLSSPGVR